jgi:hypothetical protein
MGLVVEEKAGLRTVGEVIEALRSFPADMPISDGLNDMLKVYRVKPERGETVDDKRGRVVIEEDF